MVVFMGKHYKGEVAEKAKYSAKNMAVGLKNTLKIPLH